MLQRSQTPNIANAVWASVGLGVWWAVWSLLDAYALQYTPWSELCVIAACGIVATCTLCAQRWHRIGTQRYSNKRLVTDDNECADVASEAPAA